METAFFLSGEAVHFYTHKSDKRKINKMAKLDLDIVLLDESVVMNGFRSLMSGAQLDGFKANPVMLFMHNRALAGALEPADNEVLLPIGKWYDIRVEGSRLLAKPEFDDDDEFAMKIQKKVQKGYLNAASVWIDPIAVSDEESLMLVGQYGPTLTKWGVLESSIVDIPNCRGSLAIRNGAGKRITLSGNAGSDNEVVDYLKSLIPSNKKNDMDKSLLRATLSLPETATDAQVSDALVALKLSATNNEQMNTELTGLKTKLVEMQDAAATKAVDELVDGAVLAGKFLAGDAAGWKKLAAASFEHTKTVIDAMTGRTSIEQQLAAGVTGGEQSKLELSELMKLSGIELYRQGKLARVKELNTESFKLKYKEAFGVEFPA